MLTHFIHAIHVLKSIPAVNNAKNYAVIFQFTPDTSCSFQIASFIILELDFGSVESKQAQ